ncbi:tryptophan-rich sensory protein [Hyphobacterium sp. CCMP332]|uniref:TspO/MBR family protein n=1 Tax=Hyphobacterium sp. CCMP332 TaxID=2749086 RepID=UPI00164F792A|nr:TspO/MBR family protein [Hyphobacterium sp. CCMP332]QNL20118.1 tryptophan-rich sensory protein [Hyphobacterium sp. CCMP332]
MAHTNRPTIIRLAVYWIIAAAMTGVISGLAFATGVVEWVYQDLQRPLLLPPVMILTWLWIAKTMMMALVLWIVDRFGHGWARRVSIGLLVLLYLASGGWLAGFVILRDVTFGFYAILGSWILTALTVFVIGRAQKFSAVLMWPIFIWTTFMLTVSFELMRLNSGLQLAGL